MPERIEALLRELPFLGPLRTDEIARATKRFQIVDMAPGEQRKLGAERGEALVLLSGRLAIVATPLEGVPPIEDTLAPGDHVGAISLLVGRPAPIEAKAEVASRVAILDAAGYAALEQEFPVISIPACAALASELSWKDDLLREIAVIEAAKFDGTERAAALEARRARVARRLAGRGAHVVRRARALKQALRASLNEPAFWMLAGFVTAFASARMVVSYIFRAHKENELFALHHVEGLKNPIHIHHFNYGLILVTTASFLAFFPTFRKHIRALAFVFGLGAGLIFDEFALVWRLTPDYYQPLSRWAAFGAALLLAQLAFLRDPWERAFARITGRTTLAALTRGATEP